MTDEESQLLVDFRKSYGWCAHCVKIADLVEREAKRADAAGADVIDRRLDEEERDCLQTRLDEARRERDAYRAALAKLLADHRMTTHAGNRRAECDLCALEKTA